ncbi:MAG: CHAT domain-containing protein, partial [Pseudonocardia sp.]|nr:CHAT domain-containing protein [Pseudonocardia sp.]
TDPDLATILANQAGALLAAAETLGDDTLAAAADGYRRAAALTAGHPAAHATHLAQLALVLRAHASATGDTAAVHEAVRLMREAVELAGPGHRDHAVFCSQLGSALVRRHLRHGAAGDLVEAIAWHDRAVTGITPRRVGAARWLAARAHALRLRAEQTGLPGDVTAAVTAYRAALDAEADASRLPDLLAALGSALDLRRDTVDDLAATIDVRREAVRLARPDDPMRGPWLADLANSLRLRGDPADLQEAHRLHVEAVASTPPAHPEHATVLSNLAGSHRDRYVRTGDEADLARALDLLLLAATTTTAPAQQRFVAAETAARLAADTGRWPAACAAYGTAIDLLPAAAWQGADREGRERPLRATRWLAAEAAAAALRLGEPARALALLERGRTVLWNQRTETGADLTGLRRTAPELADRLDAARAVLDAEPDDAVATPAGADARITAAAAWDAAVAELRARPGLAEALFPTVPLRIDAGTVVFVLVSRYGRHALLLDGDGPRTVALTRLDLDALADRLGDYYGALDIVVDPSGLAERRAAERRLADLLAWLGEVVVDPVLDAVTAGPRVWWCPTGPFTALPLHAAGSAPDRVVSSYTPTVTALVRSAAASDDECRHVVGVAAAQVPGWAPLPGVATELDELAAALPANTGFTRLDDARRDEVAAALRGPTAGLTWAHLACHAEQDLAQPSRAAFLLADGRLGLTELARGPRTPAAGAYLSACHSALGGADLADEALNLAAAMQHAGYHRVIATLWPVGDRPARAAARRIYRVLCANGIFCPARSATAVHDLMLDLRGHDPGTPSRWAPFVHLGP